MNDNEWFDDFFESDLWAQVHTKTKTAEQTQQEIEFVKKVARAGANLEILDMPCGVGRHAIELCKLGHRVLGVDNSKNLLRIAIDRSKELPAKPEWQQADMRQFKKPKSFDLILMLWGSLGYFSDDETQTMFSNIKESLMPGGRFVFDQPTLDTFMRGGFSMNHWSERDGLYVLEKTNWQPETSRNESQWTFVENGKAQSYTSSIRIFTYHELFSMLKKAGFAKVTAYGSMELKPFAVGDRLYCVAEG